MLDLASAAQATGGRLIGANVGFQRVTTDSRGIRAGDLFIGIRGERFDGQLFGDQALAAGANAVMVTDATSVKTAGANLVEVRDTRIALGALAAFWRRKFSIPLAAITGSNGKTTVKEMLATILCNAAGPTAILATAGNLNNDIGMPLTLLRLRDTHRFAVVEMGMNHLGEISYLTKIAAPTVALITNAGTAHIGELGSRQAIARAKGEVFEGLAGDGVAVLNADEPAAEFWRGLIGERRILDFGIDRPAAVSARYELSDSGSLLTFQAPAGKFVTTLHVPGLHNVKNALAAASVALALGLAPTQIGAGLARYRGVKGRLQMLRHPSGATLIDDTYNANPDSMKAAICVLAAYPGKKILVIGDMGELGADAVSMHVTIGDFAQRSGVDYLLGLGQLSAHCVRAFGANGRHYPGMDDLVAGLAPMLGREATVLVKGSRFMGMERVIEALGATNGETTAKGSA